MRRGALRALSVVAGVLLIIAGVVCLCHQETAALSAGILLGVFMLISGVAEIALFIWGRDFYFGAVGLLLDGILTVLLSLFLLFNLSLIHIYPEGLGKSTAGSKNRF